MTTCMGIQVVHCTSPNLKPEWSQVTSGVPQRKHVAPVPIGGSFDNRLMVDSNDVTIQQTDAYAKSDLGICVVFDSSLKFSKHVNLSIHKANQVTGIIKRNFHVKSFCLLYISLLRPHLDYGCIVWHPSLIKDIKP